jgi:hypothetical protein
MRQPKPAFLASFSAKPDDATNNLGALRLIDRFPLGADALIDERSNAEADVVDFGRE